MDTWGPASAGPLHTVNTRDIDSKSGRRTNDSGMTRPSLILIVLLMSARAAFAQSAQPPPPAAEPDYPIIRIGVLSYVQYDAELKNRDAFNAFDLTRGYVNINGQLSKNVRFRLTP